MNNTTKYFRTKKIENYSVISNLIIQSEVLTTDESFLLIYILSLPENWSLYKSYLEKYFKTRGVSKSRFNSSWKGLSDKGYIVKSRIKNDSGKFNSWDYTIIESPNPADVLKTDMSEIQLVQNSTSQVLGDIINTNIESTNKESTKIYSKEEILNLLGQLEGEDKHLTTARLNYLKSRYPEYPELLNIFTPEEIDNMSNCYPEKKLRDILDNVNFISSKLRPLIK